MDNKELMGQYLSDYLYCVTSLRMLCCKDNGMNYTLALVLKHTSLNHYIFLEKQFLGQHDVMAKE